MALLKLLWHPHAVSRLVFPSDTSPPRPPGAATAESDVGCCGLGDRQSWLKLAVKNKGAEGDRFPAGKERGGGESPPSDPREWEPLRCVGLSSKDIIVETFIWLHQQEENESRLVQAETRVSGDTLQGCLRASPWRTCQQSVKSVCIKGRGSALSSQGSPACTSHLAPISLQPSSKRTMNLVFGVLEPWPMLSEAQCSTPVPLTLDYLQVSTSAMHLPR